MSTAAAFMTTIGLEIHVELSTDTKMFCGCAVGFGGDPNTRVCPICLGHPGTLPSANEKAIEYTTKIALALGCEIAPKSIFHRKNYFYPDMPKNYQISQYDIPVGSRGLVEVEVDGEVYRVRINRVHLEEDTGKSLHVGEGGRIHAAEYSLEDFNRAGTPLVEIVTEPDIPSPEVARAFAQELRSTLEFLGVSDVRMQEGSLRIDANISVARPGERGTKAEVKNMNSMRSLFRALVYEDKRQRDLLLGEGVVEQSTRHWDERAGVTKALRSKEVSSDYRYFPEPDLVPIEPDVEWLRQLSEEIPELPSEKRRKMVAELGLSPTDAATVTSTKASLEFFEGALRAVEHATPKQVANWLANQMLGLMTERKEDFRSSRVPPQNLGKLVDLVATGALSRSQGTDVLSDMLETGRDPSAVMEEKDIRQISDTSEIESAVAEVLRSNPDVAQRIAAGDTKPFGFLVGQVMKSTRGKANPGLVTELIKQALKDK